MAVVSMKQLLESGVHFGHQTRRWNPKMAPYIFTSRNGIHIIDLQKTSACIDVAYKAMFDIAKEGGKVLFIGTKKQAQTVVREEAIRSGQFFVDKRWLGGTLTNFKTIKLRIRRLHDLYKMEKDGTFDALPKKEVIGLRKQMDRLETFLGGIKEMKELPQAIFVIDPRKEKNAILEARKLKIPVFGIIDTNCDPDDVDYIIPANDDALRAVKIIVSKFADAVVEANGGVIEKRVDTPRPKNDNYRGGDKYKAPYKKGKPGQRNDYKKPQRYNNDNKPKVEVKQDNKAVAPKVEAKVAPKAEVKVAPKVEVKAAPKAEVKATPKAETVDYSKQTVVELKKLAKEQGISGYSKLKKAELIELLSK